MGIVFRFVVDALGFLVEMKEDVILHNGSPRWNGRCTACMFLLNALDNLIFCGNVPSE